MLLQPIHPFPARMAPEVALAHCRALPPGAVVLDPMTGSGTVMRAAADADLWGIGYDVDPLAVLMARVWTTPLADRELIVAARDVAAAAQRVPNDAPLPWIDDDPETAAFVAYWFAPRQREDLRRLSMVLRERSGPGADALRIALSRLIVTKDRGASLARDVSHSRPHRVCAENTFQIFPAFLRSADVLAARLAALPAAGRVTVSRGDARDMPALADASVDAVITSPPYLNALDYLRGHRLSLVWLGYRLGELRAIRADSIGTERMLDPAVTGDAIAALTPLLGAVDALPARLQGMIDRFLIDLCAVLREIRRVLAPGGNATFVVGNSCLRGVFVDNAAALTAAAEMLGFALVERTEREIPPSRRYLPPPDVGGAPGVQRRMRSEVVLTFGGGRDGHARGRGRRDGR